MSNDNIGDVLTQIRNANLIKSLNTLIPNTRSNYQILKILHQEGLIKSFNVLSSKYLILHLKYIGRDKHPILTNLRRISKPGRRIYTSHKEVPIVLGGLGVVILSTSKGILTGREARSQSIGGEVLCSIW